MREHPCLPSLGEHCGECHRCTSPERPSTTRRGEPGGVLVATCSECDDDCRALDKGMGRARIAAWETRHGANCPQRGKGSSCRYCGHDASTHVGPYCGQPPVIEKDS